MTPTDVRSRYSLTEKEINSLRANAQTEIRMALHDLEDAARGYVCAPDLKARAAMIAEGKDWRSLRATPEPEREERHDG